MNSTTTRIAELIAIFIVLPVILAVNPILLINILLVASAIVYIFWCNRQTESAKGNQNSLSEASSNKRVKGTKVSKFEIYRIAILLTFFIIGSALYVYLYLPELFFQPILNNLKLWVFICFIYAVVSVLPQEFVYRRFFFKRYNELFTNQWTLVLANAALFSWAHLMFSNLLVMILTFLGGLLFAYTYNKTKSLKTVSIEHYVYGWWLYTIGMGQMLAFPTG